MSTCSNCGKHLPSSGRVCPYCGAKRGFMDTGISWKVVLIGLLVLFIIGKIKQCSEGGNDDKTATQTEKVISNTPTKKQKQKSKKRSKKHRSRQNINIVTINDATCSYWSIIKTD